MWATWDGPQVIENHGTVGLHIDQAAAQVIKQAKPNRAPCSDVTAASARVTIDCGRIEPSS